MFMQCGLNLLNLTFGSCLCEFRAALVYGYYRSSSFISKNFPMFFSKMRILTFQKVKDLCFTIYCCIGVSNGRLHVQKS